MKNQIISIIVLLAILGLATWAFKGSTETSKNPPEEIPNTPISATTTVQGTFVCLPHKDTSGPTTMECAFGIKADDGNYYSLDLSAYSGLAPMDIPVGTRSAVTGLLIATTSEIYDIKGMIRVESFEEITKGGASMEIVNDKVMLGLNDWFEANSTKVTAWEVTEDSRCPTDVECIQAGRVRLALNIFSPSGDSIMEIESGKTITTETLSITLEDVWPYPISSKKTKAAEYKFIFVVESTLSTN